jgi:hypothetical protein
VEFWWQSDWPVHELHRPSEGNQRTELHVVLFHGLQLTKTEISDAWSKTWTKRDHNDVCWPRDWLPIDFREPVRIFSISYNAHVVTSPHANVSQIAHNVFQTLRSPRYEWHHPIVLIGHSFGGLVLKSLVVKLNTIRNGTDDWSKAAFQRGKAFLSHVRGVAFYAVPHAGSTTKFVEYARKSLTWNKRVLGRIMDYIQPGQQDMADLSVNFEGIVDTHNINIYAFCEGRPMKKLGILVEVASAQKSAGTNYVTIEDADHMQVCKPVSQGDPSYKLLLHLINTCEKMQGEDELVSQV